MERRGHFPEVAGDPRRDAIRQLRWSMGGRGLTLDKLQLMDAVLALPVVARAVAAAAPEDAPRAAYDAVAGAARSLGNAPHARLLRASLAIDYTGDATNLSGRRKEFASVQNAHAREEKRRDYVGETMRALYSAEQAMLEELVTALGAGTVAAPAEPSRPPARGYSCVDYDVSYRLRGRFGLEAELTYKLRAEVDRLERFEAAYYCPDESGARAECEVFEGGVLVGDRLVGQPGAQVATIALPRPLRLGELHRVRFDIRYPPGRQTDTYCMLSIVRPTEHIVVRVRFDRDEVPSRVWRVEGLFSNAGTGDPDASKPLEPDPLGCVETVFDEIDVGYTYGIAWSW